MGYDGKKSIRGGIERGVKHERMVFPGRKSTTITYEVNRVGARQRRPDLYESARQFIVFFRVAEKIVRVFHVDDVSDPTFSTFFL